MSKRTYTSPLRAASSAATRERILEAAQHCFEQHGFGGTTMRAIAERAGASLESVNLAGTKRALLVAALRRALSQADTDAPLLDQPGPKALFAEPDAVAALSRLIAWVAASNLRIARIWRALDQAADTDASIHDDYHDLLSRMRAECRRVVLELGERKALRTDVSPTDLSDMLWIAILPDQHRRLCDQVGWSQERYEQWLVWSATTLLLAPHLLAEHPPVFAPAP